MRRLHLIELHEQPWYPSRWRKMFQLGLGRSQALMNAFENFRGPFRRFLDRTHSEAVLDLCSGSGEPAKVVWESIVSTLDDDSIPTLVLSDLYPPIESYEKIKAQHHGSIDFVPQPVDARHPPSDAPRVRTFFNSFHHFEPETARAILADAAHHADGVAVFEITNRSWKNMAQTVFVLPFVSAFLTAFLLRPFRVQNLVFGILLPVIPLTAVVDGVVSNLRTYTVGELEEMTRSIEEPDFAWEIDTIDIESTGLKATYLFGWKTTITGSSSSAAAARAQSRRKT